LSILLALGGWMALPASEDTALLMALDACGDGFFVPETGMIYRRWSPQMSASAEHVESYELDARRTLVLHRAQAVSDWLAGRSYEVEHADFPSPRSGRQRVRHAGLRRRTGTDGPQAVADAGWRNSA
jgi:hypothetical protein